MALTPSASDTEHTPPFRIKPGSKQVELVNQLASPGGRTLDELATALGWQKHTVRAAITGLRQKGFEVVKSKSGEGQTVYHVPLDVGEPGGESQTGSERK